MKTWQVEAWGEPSSLKLAESGLPPIGPDQVTIRHHALEYQHGNEHDELNQEHRWAHRGDPYLSPWEDRRLHQQLQSEHTSEHHQLNREHGELHRDLREEHDGYHGYDGRYYAPSGGSPYFPFYYGR